MSGSGRNFNPIRFKILRPSVVLFSSSKTIFLLNYIYQLTLDPTDVMILKFSCLALCLHVKGVHEVRGFIDNCHEELFSS